MKADEPEVKQVLEVLVGGGRCDYAPVFGGIMLLDNESKPIGTGVNVSTFLELGSEGLIEHKSSIRQGHNIFPRNVRIDTYEITAKGREYFQKLA